MNSMPAGDVRTTISVLYSIKFGLQKSVQNTQQPRGRIPSEEKSAGRTKVVMDTRKDYPYFDIACKYYYGEDTSDVKNNTEIVKKLITGINNIKNMDGTKMLDDTWGPHFASLKTFLKKTGGIIAATSKGEKADKDPEYPHFRSMDKPNEASKSRFLFYYFLNAKYLEIDEFDKPLMNLNTLYEYYRLIDPMNVYIAEKRGEIQKQKKQKSGWD